MHNIAAHFAMSLEIVKIEVSLSSMLVASNGSQYIYLRANFQYISADKGAAPLPYAGKAFYNEPF